MVQVWPSFDGFDVGKALVCMSCVFKVGLHTMFCCSVWCNALSSRLALNKFKVFSKLSNTFVGHVENPCFKPSKALQAYTILRNIQDQVAKMLKHAYLPSRYLAIYVGSFRLTKPDFPFVDELDAQESSQVLEVLQGAFQGALRLDVMYDEEYAKRSGKCVMSGIGLDPALVCNAIAEQRLTRTCLFTKRMEVWNFLEPIRKIAFFNTDAQRFGCVGIFDRLQTVHMVAGCKVSKPNMADFAPCKMLTKLVLTLEGPSGTGLNGISELVNLQTLCVSFCDTPDQSGVYPFDEITTLEKLHTLILSGGQICGCIPKEIHKLQCLECLSLGWTSLSSSIPTEIGQLAKLGQLWLTYNERLVGGLPKELDNLESLYHIDLEGTPHVGARTVMTHGTWHQDTWKKYW